MAELTDDDIEIANESGRIEFETKPHAANARYDRRTGLMTLNLYNGCTFTFPPRELQGLADASDDELAAFDLGSFGYGVHWEALNADFTVPGLLAGQFGTARFMESRRARLGAVYDQLIGSLDSLDSQAAE